jgi:hypothetical protein
MPTNQIDANSSSAHVYHFTSNWQVQGSAVEVYEILSDASLLPAWWPSVYLDVKVLDKGQADGTGRSVALYTKGWLPYTLLWHFVVTQVCKPNIICIQAQGDFNGFGKWTIKQSGATCNITFDWHIQANKFLLKKFSFLLKPLFAANHSWAMAQGEQALILELLRRRGDLTGAPQGPSFPHNLTNNKILYNLYKNHSKNEQLLF